MDPTEDGYGIESPWSEGLSGDTMPDAQLDRVGTRPVPIDPELIARARRPDRASKEELQTLEDAELESALSQLESEGLLEPEPDDTFTKVPELGLGDVKTRLAPPGYGPKALTPRESPGFLFTDDEETVIAPELSSTDDEETAIAPGLLSDDDEATASAFARPAEAVERDRPSWQLREAIDIQLDDFFGDEVEVTSPTLTAIPRNKLAQEVTNDDDGDVTADIKSPRAANLLMDFALDDAEVTAPVLQNPLGSKAASADARPDLAVLRVAIQQVGVNAKMSSPRDLPKKRGGSDAHTDEDQAGASPMPQQEADSSARQATLALAYEIPEKTGQVIALTHVKQGREEPDAPPAQGQPFSQSEHAPHYEDDSRDESYGYRDASPDDDRFEWTHPLPSEDPDGLTYSASGRRRRSRARPVLIAVTVLLASAVAGLVLAYFFASHSSVQRALSMIGLAPPSEEVAEPTEQRAGVGGPARRDANEGGEAPSAPPPPPASVVASADAATAEDAETIPRDEDPSSTELPGELILPFTFEEREYEEVEIDEDALERIVAVMLARPELRFEVVGYASASESQSPQEALFISGRRARKAVRILRGYGPRGTRFTPRGARSADVPPGGEPGSFVVLKTLEP